MLSGNNMAAGSFNPLATGSFESNFRQAIFKLISMDGLVKLPSDEYHWNLLMQAGKLALALSPMRVKIWPGEWKTGLGEWNFVSRLYKRLPSSCEYQKILVSHPADDKSVLVQVMAWYRQVISHYFSQNLPRCCHVASLCHNELIKPVLI